MRAEQVTDPVAYHGEGPTAASTAGQSYDQRLGAGALCRLDLDRSVRVVLANVTVSNGLEWSPDGSRAYYTTRRPTASRVSGAAPSPGTEIPPPCNPP